MCSAIIEKNAAAAAALSKESWHAQRGQETERRQAERKRQRTLDTYTASCEAKGIKMDKLHEKKHAKEIEHLAKLKEKEVEEEREFKRTKKERTSQLEMDSRELEETLRAKPIGIDRYFNRYFLFSNDEANRLYLEEADSGALYVYENAEDMEALTSYLMPKGMRELSLLNAFKNHPDCMKPNRTSSKKDRSILRYRNPTIHAVPSIDEDTESEDDTAVETLGYGELELFPEHYIHVDRPTVQLFTPDDTRCDTIHSELAISQMLVALESRLGHEEVVGEEWEAMFHADWLSAVTEKGASISQLQEALLNLCNFVAEHGHIAVMPSWTRRTHEWTKALEGAKTVAQLFFLIHTMMHEMIHVDALMDLTTMMDRKPWLKLQGKDKRTFIPAVGDHVVYFSAGHAAAHGNDKSKSFVWEGNVPVKYENSTSEYTVTDITYHDGGGDPYARIGMESPTNCKAITKPAGSRICAMASSEQQLCRIILRILHKIEKDHDAEPFMNLVDKKDFSDYYQIVPRPICLTDMKMKAKAAEYTTINEFEADMSLLLENCRLYCEDRYDDLPPMATRLVEIAKDEVFHLSTPLADCSKTNSVNKIEETDVKSEDKMTVILRLEDRLENFLLAVTKYNAIVSMRHAPSTEFTWKSAVEEEELYNGLLVGSIPYLSNGLLPWDALLVAWEDDKGKDDRINPWYVND